MASTGWHHTLCRVGLVAACSAGIAVVALALPGSEAALATSGPDVVAGSVVFRVTNPQSTRVAGAGILVVDHIGRILATGRTDKSGSWTVSLHIPVDARFKTQPPFGTVTAIVAAAGYNEAIVLDVPVQPTSAQPVTLLPTSDKGRNEPELVVGNIHHQAVITTVDHYARLAHWTRQSPAPGEGRYAPYAPTGKRS